MGTVTHIYDHVDAVNLTQRRALLASKRVFPITHIFDCQGRETNDIEKAFSGVCGHDNEWLAFQMSDFGKDPDFVPPEWAYDQEAG